VSHRKERSKSPRSHSTHNKGAVISVGFHQRLSAYATAAAAAGVGLLATATPANADIVFTPTWPHKASLIRTAFWDIPRGHRIRPSR